MTGSLIWPEPANQTTLRPILGVAPGLTSAEHDEFSVEARSEVLVVLVLPSCAQVQTNKVESSGHAFLGSAASPAPGPAGVSRSAKPLSNLLPHSDKSRVFIFPFDRTPAPTPNAYRIVCCCTDEEMVMDRSSFTFLFLTV